MSYTREQIEERRAELYEMEQQLQRDEWEAEERERQREESERLRAKYAREDAARKKKEHRENFKQSLCHQYNLPPRLWDRVTGDTDAELLDSAAELAAAYPAEVEAVRQERAAHLRSVARSF